MARKKSADTLDAEIAKVKSDMSKLQDRYDRLAEKLKDLQEQKRRIEADAIMDAYLKSGKTLDEIMTFLKP
jgi:predicted  nucleic acid-binding Zn-ribbon protein